MRTGNPLIYFVPLLWLFGSCESSFLELKRDRSHVVPTTVAEFNAMLDNYGVMNSGAGYALGIIASDEHYLTAAEWDLLPTVQEENGYIWAADVFALEETYDWNTPHRRILYANIILEGLDKISFGPHQGAAFDRVKGGALFHRGMAYYQLADRKSTRLNSSP